MEDNTVAGPASRASSAKPDGPFGAPPVWRFESSYAVFDLETTGLNPRIDHIIEIGWCVVRDGQPAETRSALLPSPIPIPPVVQRLTGITDALLRSASGSPDSALRHFATETADLPLVGHNVLRFDMPFLEALVTRCGLSPPFRGRYRDTLALFKAYRLGMKPRPGQDHWSFANEALARRAPSVRSGLDACCAFFGISHPAQQRHRAAGDVTLTRLVYERLRALSSDASAP